MQLSQTILDIYFAKLLHENKERTTQEFKMVSAQPACDVTILSLCDVTASCET